MSFFSLVPYPTWSDALDILFLTVVVYQLYIWFRESRALRVLIGLAALGGIYSLAKLWSLFLTTMVFQVLWQMLLILLVILFQSEIKQVLERVSPLRYLRLRKHGLEDSFARDLAETAFDLAAEKTGALIVLAREDNPAEYIHSGQTVMAAPLPVLIKSIFNRHAPTHDGAVLIAGGTLAQVGCILPLSERQDLPESYGTRHRAAFGLSELTDAVCVVVSEERGEVSTIVAGELVTWRRPEELSEKLRTLLGEPEAVGRLTADALRSVFLRNWRPKLAAFGLIVVSWMALAGQQVISASVSAPIHYSVPPAGLEMEAEAPDTVRLSLSGRRRAVQAVQEQDIRVQLNVSDLAEGVHIIRLSRKDVDLPLGISIDGVAPQEIQVRLRPVSPPQGG
jgi:uncharacterized protein (TIGR00159 family)